MIELERQVVASIMLADMNDASNALFDEARELGVGTEVFLNIFCAEIWAAMADIHAKGEVIDEISVRSNLMKKSVF